MKHPPLTAAPRLSERPYGKGLALHDAEALAFRYAPDATLLLGDRCILLASHSVFDTFGWHPAELEGQSIRLLYPAESDYRRIGDRARRAMARSQTFSDERFMRHKSGEALWMAGRGRAIDAQDPEKLAVWSYRPLETGAPQPGGLTRAEIRVAGYLINGFTSKEIARSLECSPRTVEVHRANMIRKMNVRNSFELVNVLLAARKTRGASAAPESAKAQKAPAFDEVESP